MARSLQTKQTLCVGKDILPKLKCRVLEAPAAGAWASMAGGAWTELDGSDAPPVPAQVLKN